MRRFPNDCSEKDCQYCHIFDMSIDDLVVSCDILKQSCDACDGDFCSLLCPLDAIDWEALEDTMHEMLREKGINPNDDDDDTEGKEIKPND